MLNEKYYSILLKNYYKNTNKVRNHLLKSIKFAIDNGATGFILSYEGYFNKMALNICREFRKIYPFLIIKIVIMDLNMHFQRDTNEYKKLYKYYEDIDIIFYYPDPDKNKIYQLYNFLIIKSLWTMSYITKPLQQLFKQLCQHKYISVIDLKNLQKLCFHKKNDELPHQILKSIII